MSESEIQTKIIKHHTASGWMVTKIIQTTRNGFPDLMLLKNGQCVFVEVKRNRSNKSTPLQRYVQGQLKSAGFDTFETCDPDFFL